MSSALCKELESHRDPKTDEVVGVASKLTYWAGPEGTANLANYARSDFVLPLQGNSNMVDYSMGEDIFVPKAA